MNEKELLAEISRLRIRIAEMESLSAGAQVPGDLDSRGEGILYLTDALPVTIAYVDAKGHISSIIATTGSGSVLQAGIFTEKRLKMF